jgi:hypothetical protein
MEIFFGVFFIALLVTAIVSFAYRSERSFGALSMFFLLIFFPVWALALWIPAVGPVYYGVAWAEFIFFALIVTFLILAVSSPNHDINKGSLPKSTVATKDESAVRSYSAAFWAFIAFMIVAVVLGANRTTGY